MENKISFINFNKTIQAKLTQATKKSNNKEVLLQNGFVNENSNDEEPSLKTTLALGEEGGDLSVTRTSQALGEEGGDSSVTSQALGEEGGDSSVTTLALGEEGGDSSVTTNNNTKNVKTVKTSAKGNTTKSNKNLNVKFANTLYERIKNLLSKLSI